MSDPFRMERRSTQPPSYIQKQRKIKIPPATFCTNLKGAAWPDSCLSSSGCFHFSPHSLYTAAILISLLCIAQAGIPPGPAFPSPAELGPCPARPYSPQPKSYLFNYITLIFFFHIFLPFQSTKLSEHMTLGSFPNVWLADTTWSLGREQLAV